MQRWPDPPPTHLARLVLRLRNWLRRLTADMIPGLTVFEDCIGTANTQVLSLVARYGIADSLQQGPRTAAELAEPRGLLAEPLHRLLRCVASRGYFRLDSHGRFHNTRLSRCLVGSHPEKAGDFCEFFASRSNSEAWMGLDQVLRSGQDSFTSVHGVSVWEWFERHPEEQATFARAMHARTAVYASAIAEIYPFAEISNVCDLAGGQGGLISEVAIRHPELAVALYEVEGVLRQAERFLASRGLEGRVERIPGDIFRTVPVAYQLYLMKNVLHDWDDQACIEILGNVRHAMLPDSRLLVVEFVLEANQTDSLGALNDLQMMVVTAGGRERSLADFDRLLVAAGLRRTRVWPTVTMTLLEARLA